MLFNFYVSLLIISLIATLCAISPPSLCVITQGTNFSDNTDYYYPIEVFYKDRLINGLPIDPYEPCGVRKKIGFVNHSCPIQVLGCPMIVDNLHEGLSKALQWKKATSLCQFKEKLQVSMETIQVAVFGGSVTEGVDGSGCNRLQPKLFKRCSWVHYLEPWLNSIGKAKFKVYNFGKAGTTSEYSAERMSGYFNGKGIKTLSSSEMILIDHSFNDATLCSPHRIRSLENGLELLIRRLLLLSKSWTEIPSIILFSNVFGSSDMCHQRVYSALAQHYGLRFYSYTDAISSNNSITKQHMFHHNVTSLIAGTPHPPWYTYLFYADFFATLLQYEMENCNVPPFNADGTTVPYLLPEPLMKSEVNESLGCNTAVKPLLRISYHDITSNSTIGDFYIPYARTWQVKLDRKGRGGIISELDYNTNLVEAQQAPIELTLTTTVGEVMELIKRSDVIIQVTYLRSYVNSGVVVLNVCGQDYYREDMDALWPDYNEYRYTMPAIRNYRINDANCSEVGDLNARMKIVLKHKLVLPQKEELSSVNVTSLIHSMPRMNQFFKIISVVVCRN